jgi:hypothetical protein
VQRLVQVICGRTELELRPELLNQVLAVEPVTWRQGQELDQAPDFAPSPLLVCDGARADRDTKGTEEVDSQIGRRPPGFWLRFHRSPAKEPRGQP